MKTTEREAAENWVTAEMGKIDLYDLAVILRMDYLKAKTSDGRGWKAVERLQRGNDALRDQIDDLKDELTRLRELLERVKGEVKELNQK